MDDMPATTDDLTSLSYEQARDELVRVVNDLEAGSATLEESLKLWERGEALARRCEEWLIGAKKTAGCRARRRRRLSIRQPDS